MEISQITLKQHVTGKEFRDVPLESLAANSHVVLLILRRPGCILCRDFATRLWRRHEEFDRQGARLVVVFHEWVQREIDGFAPKYWGGDIFWDPKQATYSLTHGGKHERRSKLSLLNPWNPVYKKIREVKKRGTVESSNLKGDGGLLGGVLVLARGGEIVYTYAEKEFGDNPPEEEVLSAAERAGAAGEVPGSASAGEATVAPADQGARGSALDPAAAGAAGAARSAPAGVGDAETVGPAPAVSRVAA